MAAGLALDPGLGKTSITLQAFLNLKAAGMVRRMLVIAPLRVCRTVWRQEGAKWTQFRHLRFSLLHGAKKTERLRDDADIWLINPEGIPWLSQQYFGRQLPFDIVTIDELTKFKNAQSERSKKLRPRIKRVPRKWGLTGSLAPNGYMDLFGQQLMLDEGAALGRYITHYRDQYFQLDYNGLEYTLLPGSEKRIVRRIAPYWLQMSADDYLQLPPLLEDVREAELSPESRRLYDSMRRDMLATLPEGVVTAANAAAVYSKLAQMANGAVYYGSDRAVAVIHNEKLDMLEELLEELNGQPLLLAYEFNHDLARIKERFGEDLPYLGKGTTAAQEAAWIAAWNRNELPLMAMHPASAAHGLNMQEGSAGHVGWFGPIWDLELYDQFIRRVRRQGNTAQRIINHLLLVRGTIDELKRDALRDKDTTQSRLLRALNTEILRDAEARTGGSVSETRSTMTAKLARQHDAPAAASQAEAPRRVVPKGWGSQANTAAATPPPANDGQRDRIREQLQGQAAAAQEPEDGGEGEQAPAAERARSAFSGATQAARAALAAQPTDDPEATPPATTPAPAKPTRTRSRGADKPATEPAPWSGSVSHDLRVRLLELAFGPAFAPESVDEGMEIAAKLHEFAENGPER